MTTEAKETDQLIPPSDLPLPQKEDQLIPPSELPLPQNDNIEVIHQEVNSEFDPVSEEEENPKSLSEKTRKGFIIKVYSILVVQLLITSISITLTMCLPAYRHWQLNHLWIAIVLAVVSAILLYAMFCYPTLAQKVPTNYLLLMIFTLC